MLESTGIMRSRVRNSVPERRFTAIPKKSARMVISALAGLLAILLAPAPSALAGTDKGYRIAPPGGWVTPMAVPSDYVIPKDDVEDGIYDVLTDDQTRVGDGGVERYRRVAYEILNDAGIEGYSSLSIEYDPSYQTVILHHIRIQRGNRIIEQLDPDRIELLRREEDLERLQYDGRRTVHMLLQDVRKGDVIDYAYTIAGYNPALNNVFYGGFRAGWGAPVEKIRRRLLWPSHRPLSIRSHNTALQPSETTHGHMTEYLWQAEHLPPVRYDSQTPNWYQQYHWIQLSEARSWREVAEYERAIFAQEQALPPAARAVVDRIMAEHNTAADRMVAALRFVQDEIRYISISKGTGGMIPNDLATILSRRYGDCKDKTVLLLALLRAMDITAYAVLANMDVTRGLKSFLPSQFAFDHVFVQAVVGGHPYWIDGTMTHQKGTADTMVQPDYGPVLVLKPGTTGLTEMPQWQPSEPERHITTSLDLSAGSGSPGVLTIITTHRGRNANSFRAKLARTGKSRLQQQYLEYYDKDHDGLTLHTPFIVRHDDDRNEITVTEAYTIPAPWYFNAEDQKWYADLNLKELRSYLKEPDDTRRTAPFALDFPQHVTFDLRVTLPPTATNWDISGTQDRIENPYFELDYRKRFDGQNYSRSFVLRTRKDHVPADEIENYVKELDKAYDLTSSFSLRHKPDGGAFGPCPDGCSEEPAASVTDDETPPVLFANYLLSAFLLLGCIYAFNHQIPAVWYRLLRSRSNAKNHVSLELPDIVGEYQYDAMPDHVWHVLTENFEAITGQRITLVSGHDEPRPAWTMPWPGADVRAGMLIREKDRLGIYWSHASEVTEAVPGKRLVIHTTMQRFLEIPGFRSIQGDATMSFDLQGEDDGTTLTIRNTIRYRYPVHRMFWISLICLSIHAATRRIAHRLKRKLRRYPLLTPNASLSP